MRNERQNDTIAAIATPPGEGGIAIVRISGARAGEFLRAAFRPAHKGEMKHGQMRYGTLTDPAGTPIDEVMAVFFRAPRSYTREDVAEIHLHGGTMCARAAMERLLALGARAAEPGEFTYRAFMNGRVDLSEAEAIMGLIGARSQAARRASIRQLRGGVSAPIGRMREELTGLLAKIEAATDFPDEIDEDVTAKDVREGASRIRNELSRAADGKRARIVRDGASVVLCGRPNVGKSSLMNALLSADRAIVTDIPGTTRDVLTESFEIGGVRYQLSDTAGIRETADAIEKIGVDRARDALRDADCVLLVLDSSAPLTPADQTMLATRDERYITVLNKSDLAPAAAAATIARAVNESGSASTPIACSANTKAPNATSASIAFPANEPVTASAPAACAANAHATTSVSAPAVSSVKDTGTAASSAPAVSFDKDTGTTSACAANAHATTSVSAPTVSSVKDTGTAVASVSPVSLAKDTGTAASSVSLVSPDKDTGTAAPSIPREPIRASAKTGEGIDEILRAIEHMCRQSGASEDQMTLPRHIECAHNAMQALDRAIRSIESNLPLDLCATDLREALAHLGDITGETMNEHVIDRVFSDFCVGK
ncbi:MAG: tRNA uridine-5-carboxymethylaminomethyl(34) synthesis GTPase MnmE [Clostridia bacterium]|nr:tRNA uridine-5-carboxymethylaminomethyl(34) synthesis GTPase MnmE [Clostridia bacterium]